MVVGQFATVLLEHFAYDSRADLFTIREQGKFKTHLDEKLRIYYYLVSLLTRREREGNLPTFEEIAWTILPLLKNGTTPENQTVLGVLEDIAERTGDDRWRLKSNRQPTLFGGH